MASPGGRDYSRLSAVVRYAMDVQWVTDVGPASFFPRPSVDSTVLRFDPIKERMLPHEHEKALFQVIKAAFSKRRKSLRNAMAGGELKLEKTQVDDMLKTAGIEPGRRAETLSVEEFCRMTLAMINSGE